MIYVLHLNSSIHSSSESMSELEEKTEKLTERMDPVEHRWDPVSVNFSDGVPRRKYVHRYRSAQTRRFTQSGWAISTTPDT